MTLITKCPHCDEDVDVPDDVEVSETVTCENCEHMLEVVSLEPLLLGEWDEEEK